MKTLLFELSSVLLFWFACLQPAFSAEEVIAKETLPGSSQYEFLIGDWDIKLTKYDVPGGEIEYEMTAWQHAEYKDNGQMIVDEWTGYDLLTKDKISYGITLRTYSDETQHWQNVYFSSNQEDTSTSFVSRWEDNEMQGRGQFELPDYGTITYKLRYYNITKNGFEWEQQVSNDGGENWFLDLRQVAKRRPAK